MIYAVIDRFEEDKAVLLAGDEEDIKINFPRRLLDKNLKEGDYVTIDIKYDDEATQNAKEEVASLLNSLKK
ncbi:DUF3006 domain-containing protein [Megamonas hypermegale]|uniref:DUF3006 domain-containing protein n=1 Tax=Megamonas hypermegale TaxID=158847 RepID=UPI003208A655